MSFSLPEEDEEIMGRNPITSQESKNFFNFYIILVHFFKELNLLFPCTLKKNFPLSLHVFFNDSKLKEDGIMIGMRLQKYKCSEEIFGFKETE